MSDLLSPLTLRSVTMPNRIWMSPMAMYQAEPTGPRAATVTDFHWGHHGARAAGGAGLVMVESTAIRPEGRETPHDLGLWNDTQRDELARLAQLIGSHGAVPGIQLGHAGRKASTQRPWEGDGALAPADGGWPTVGPSALAFGDRPAPRELSVDDLHRLIDAYTASARRAREAGFRVLEIHGAHGYLLHSFLSPVSNRRQDEFGGDFDGRARLPLAVVEAVRAVWPADLPLFFRVSATDWVTETRGEQAWTASDTVRLAHLLHDRGVDLIDVSSGGILPDVTIPKDIDYQSWLAARVRAETAGTGLAVASVGRIADPAEASRRLADGDADAVFIGRQLLREPSFPRRVAALTQRALPTHDSYAWAI